MLASGLGARPVVGAGRAFPQRHAARVAPTSSIGTSLRLAAVLSRPRRVGLARDVRRRGARRPRESRREGAGSLSGCARRDANDLIRDASSLTLFPDAARLAENARQPESDVAEVEKPPLPVATSTHDSEEDVKLDGEVDRSREHATAVAAAVSGLEESHRKSSGPSRVVTFARACVGLLVLGGLSAAYAVAYLLDLLTRPVRALLRALGVLAARDGEGRAKPLAEVLRADPSDAEAAAEMERAFSEVARTHPAEASVWFERRYLSSLAEPSSQLHDVTIRSYLIALVRSGRLALFDAEARTGLSVAGLLRDLQALLSGAPLSSPPGSSPLRPMFVVSKGSEPTPQRKQSGGILVPMLLLGGFLAIASWLTALSAVRSAGSLETVAAGSSSDSSSSSGSASHIKEYGKTGSKQATKTFADVCGCNEAREELKDVVEFLKHPDRFTRLGGKLPKGVLLTGPPGTGKTLLARAVAGEAGVPFFYKAGSEFDEMLVGVGSRRVRQLFAAAKAKMPCIIFIDEIDAIGSRRTDLESSGGSRKTLNQLLTEMDGFEENSGIVVMAATNAPEILDPALTRPGRFDRSVSVPLPDVHGRREILDLYLKNKPLAADVDSALLARRTPGFSGAELASLVNEAALACARAGASVINAAALDEARDKLIMGIPRAFQQSDEARRLTAYHEGGHALVALLTPGAKPIHKATIVPRGEALGMVSQVPKGDEYSVSKRQLLASIDVALAGRCAEQLVFGEDDTTTGASSDLEAATSIARHMVEDCGMSELGPVALGGRAARNAAPSTRAAVDAAVLRILSEASRRVDALMRSHEPALHSLAKALLEQETMNSEQIASCVTGAGFKLATT